MSVLKRILKAASGALKTVLKVVGWLFIVAAAGAAGLVLAGVSSDAAPWYGAFLVYWLILLQPAAIAAAIVSIFPKGRRTPVFTSVFWAALAVFLVCAVVYYGHSVSELPPSAAGNGRGA